MRLRIADAHGIGLSEFNARPDSDRDAAIGLRLYDADVHADCGVHRSEWDERLGGHRDASSRSGGTAGRARCWSAPGRPARPTPTPRAGTWSSNVEIWR
jgi:hypothetical protein